MVFINNDNIYALRDYLLEKAKELSKSDSYKRALLNHLGFAQADSNIQTTQLYKRCAILGFSKDITEKEREGLEILLGQAHGIDGTPSPWVSDIWGILGIKLAVDKLNDVTLENRFNTWIMNFLPQRLKDNRLLHHERALADFVIGNEFTPESAPSIVLFLHFQNIQLIEDGVQKGIYIIRFLNEFKNAYNSELPGPVLSVLIFVFDKLNIDSALTPPNNWKLCDLLNFLNNIPAGLRRWTWENSPRTAGGAAIKWEIENEYHVQNLLYVLLGPIFKDVTDENYAASVGQKNPRIDLYLPSLHTIIEVKYRKDCKKSFPSLIGEVSEDAGLYHADPRYKNCALIIFLWDQTKATQEHTKFREGVLKIPGIDGCVIVSSPSSML